MSTEDTTKTIEENKDTQESSNTTEPEITQTEEVKETPKDNINEKILETLKELNATNIKLKAELDGQKATINEMKAEMDASKPLLITVDEFLPVYDYSGARKALISKEEQNEEAFARERYDSIKSMYNVI